MFTKLALLIVSAFFFYSGYSGNSEKVKIQGYLYSDGKPVSIEVVNGKIVKIKRISLNPDLPKIYIAPGLIDIQINGYMGVDFSGQNLTKEDMKGAIKSLWKVGVTSVLPTVVPNEPSRMINSFTILSELTKDEEIRKSIPGFHLEGPYISPEQGYRGAHLEKYIRKPDWNEFAKFQEAAQNNIKLITVAPEVEGAIPFIQKCVQSGLIVSLGHHNGTTESIEAAVAAGASMSTHLGNGCANMINRHLNPLWPQLANDKLTAGIIVDGFHLNKEEVQCFYKMKGYDKTILVSDAVDLAGLPPGEYIRREKKLVLTADNIVKFPAENVLAGAANPISICVGNMMKFTGCSLSDAIGMASTNPAKLLGLDELGEIKTGKRADLILFRMDGNRIVVMKTMLKGKIVYNKDISQATDN
jgi:N-acetylglucosamine-6-phosphate deacetylase